MFGLVEVPQDGKAGTGGTGKKPGVVPETLKPPPAARILAKQSTSGILAKPSTSGGEKQAAWKGTWGRLGEAATANARACVFVCVCVYIYLYIYTPEYYSYIPPEVYDSLPRFSLDNVISRPHSALSRVLSRARSLARSQRSLASTKNNRVGCVGSSLFSRANDC